MTCKHEIKIVTDSDGNQWVAKCDGEVATGLFKLSDSDEIKTELDYCRQRVDDLNTEKRELNKLLAKKQFYIKCWQAVSSSFVGFMTVYTFGG